MRLINGYILFGVVFIIGEHLVFIDRLTTYRNVFAFKYFDNDCIYFYFYFFSFLERNEELSKLLFFLFPSMLKQSQRAQSCFVRNGPLPISSFLAIPVVQMQVVDKTRCSTSSTKRIIRLHFAILFVDHVAKRALP